MFSQTPTRQVAKQIPGHERRRDKVGPPLLQAELYAVTRGAVQALEMMTLISDFGTNLNAIVHTDDSAAIGIVRRTGLGKLCHLNVRYLWL